jgi:uncharacterized protein (DUF1697 family)
MSLVEFLRGVNVGGHKTFQPSIVAKELAHLGLVNVGAAGTFVVPRPMTEAALRDELARKLPFEAELMICRGRDLTDLAESAPFPGGATETDASRFVSVMSKTPRKLPALPISRPEGKDWQVKLVAVSGPFALTLWRRLGKSPLYPNEVVEKTFGVSTTTRNWNTIVKISAILK